MTQPPVDPPEEPLGGALTPPPEEAPEPVAPAYEPPPARLRRPRPTLHRPPRPRRHPHTSPHRPTPTSAAAGRGLPAAPARGAELPDARLRLGAQWLPDGASRGRSTRPRSRPGPERGTARSVSSRPGRLGPGLGIVVLRCCGPLGIVALIFGNKDLAEMDAGTMDPAGRAPNVGRLLGIVSLAFLVIQVVFGHLRGPRGSWSGPEPLHWSRRGAGTGAPAPRSCVGSFPAPRSRNQAGRVAPPRTTHRTSRRTTASASSRPGRVSRNRPPSRVPSPSADQQVHLAPLRGAELVHAQPVGQPDAEQDLLDAHASSRPAPRAPPPGTAPHAAARRRPPGA